MIDRYIPPEARGEVEPIVISESDVDITAIRSSGPGGQGVNKTNSKAELRWDLEGSGLLNEDQKATVREKLSTRINRDGVLVLHVQKTRSQKQNKEIALERLNELVNAALEVPKERVATKKHRGTQAKERKARTLSKRKKEMRRKPTSDNY
jgi:ribosome-associated protein